MPNNWSVESKLIASMISLKLETVVALTSALDKSNWFRVDPCKPKTIPSLRTSSELEKAPTLAASSVADPVAGSNSKNPLPKLAVIIS